MFASVMENKRTQKDYDAFLTDIVKRLLLLEKDIHILLIAHRQTVKFDFDRLISRKDAAAIFGYSVRHFDRICNSCHIKRIHVPNEDKHGSRTFFRWGDQVHDVFVNSGTISLSLANQDGDTNTRMNLNGPMLNSSTSGNWISRSRLPMMTFAVLLVPSLHLWSTVVVVLADDASGE